MITKTIEKYNDGFHGDQLVIRIEIGDYGISNYQDVSDSVDDLEAFAKCWEGYAEVLRELAQMKRLEGK